MLVRAMARKPMVMALDTPVTDQPVSRAMGCSSTGSENMPPMATQPSTPPAATITQRYRELAIPDLQYGSHRVQDERDWTEPTAGWTRRNILFELRWPLFVEIGRASCR